ncbi:MAG: hypothetical protein IJW39_04885 [Opitutales bacterium]|nr:hypothetical protein [Opitutales bacterium]
MRFEIRDLRAPRAAVSLRRDSVFGANESFPRRGITNLLPGAATRFARLPRAMFLLRFQRVFLPFFKRIFFFYPQKALHYGTVASLLNKTFFYFFVPFRLKQKKALRSLR